MTTGWLLELKEALGEAVTTDGDIVAANSRDQTVLADAGPAACLVRPRSPDDVTATLEIADRHRVPVVVRGAGTGLAGGANAVEGCIILSTRAMNRILSVDPAARIAVVEPGVLNADLVAAAAEHGLWYAPDPSSRAVSTIGGNVATNAGGACCLKYGVTGDHVLGLTTVIPGGSVVRTGSATTKNVTGLDLTRLLVGSEGTLGVIVDVTLRLQSLPLPPATLVAAFDSLAGAGAAVLAMENERALSVIELMDGATLRAINAHARMDLDTSSAALLLVQSDSRTASDDIDACAAACTSAGATYVAATDDPWEGEKLMQARRLALPSLERLGTVLLDDVAVPKPAIPAMLERITQIAAEHSLVIGTFGHAGDGNLHPTIVFDPSDQASTRAAQAAFNAILRTAVELGGVITGEHGVGVLKRPQFTELADPTAIRLMRQIRAVFDPNGIMNPGKAY